LENAGAGRIGGATALTTCPRLSRDAAEMLRLARLLEYARITLISVADSIETGIKLSKLTLSVKAIFNEQYLDDLRERTLRGLSLNSLRRPSDSEWIPQNSPRVPRCPSCSHLVETARAQSRERRPRDWQVVLPMGVSRSPHLT
jgi:hypothetical protein